MSTGTGPSPAAAELVRFVEGMVGGDGYGVVVKHWPDGDSGHAQIEIVPHEGACADCLVPKGVLSSLLANQLPPGVVIGEDDIAYPRR